MFELCAAPSTKPQALLLSFHCSIVWSYAGQKSWGDEKEAKVISQETLRPKALGSTPIFYAMEQSFPAEELITSMLAMWRGNRISFQRENHLVALSGAGNMVARWPCTLSSRQLRSEGPETSAGKAVCSLQGLASRPEAAGTQQGCRCGGIHPQCLHGLNTAHSRNCEAGDLLDKQPREDVISNISVH